MLFLEKLAEEVIIELVKKHMPCLLYGLLYFAKKFFEIARLVVVRFLMKLFKTVNNEIIRECCSYFKFTLPSELQGGMKKSRFFDQYLVLFPKCCKLEP